jgi:hypothetical protein
MTCQAGGRRPSRSRTGWTSILPVRLFPSLKRLCADLFYPLDLDYASLLRSMEVNSPMLLNKAKDRFQRAARLEERQAKEANLVEPIEGEAARWLAIVR